MTLIIDFSDQAKQDVTEISQYVGERNSSAAERFVDAVTQTVLSLCEYPTQGERLYSDTEGKIRVKIVSDFRNYLIFFRQENETLQVIRVLHGARDYSATF